MAVAALKYQANASPLSMPMVLVVMQGEEKREAKKVREARARPNERITCTVGEDLLITSTKVLLGLHSTTQHTTHCTLAGSRERV